MAEFEKLSNVELGETTEDSQFGDNEKICEIMNRGEVVSLGPIDELYEGQIPEHANVVEVVDAKPAELNANQVLGVKIQVGENNVRCVFKPVDGENKQVKNEWGISNESFYPREFLAYLVAKHFKFDIVPPTTMRKVGNAIGSLQLFLDPKYYSRPAEVSTESFDAALNSPRASEVTVFDWMLANCERHSDNWLISKDEPEKISCIDHGLTFWTSIYAAMDIRGPSLRMTYDVEKSRPKKIPIPEEVKLKISNGLERRDELTRNVLDILAESEGIQYELGQFWHRVENLENYGMYLSRENYKLVTGHSLLKDMRE